VVLCAGAGTDTSFESLLVDRFGCRVHVLDPVPAAADHVAAALAHEPRITFEQAALWTVDTELTFHEPEVAGHVSHSVPSSRPRAASPRCAPSTAGDISTCSRSAPKARSSPSWTASSTPTSQ